MGEINLSRIVIREERLKDRSAIRQVNEQAFGQQVEADIVDRLRENCPNILSLVAVQEEQVVGHILFSPAKIEGDGKAVQGMGLAPVAVTPEWQRQGIGSLLVQTGIKMLKYRGCVFVILLGHPEYYPRFGFERASQHGIRSQWDGIPDEAFMILVLDRSAMKDISGVAWYRSEFNEAI
jgi:putative acetyltransferase